MKAITTTNNSLILIVFLMLVISENHAATLYSTGASDWKWSSTTSWTYNSNGTGSCGCVPSSGDIINIRVTDSISVPTNINVAGNTTTNVYGELNITGFLDLLGSGSVVNIYPGGQLTSNGSASSKLRIGGTATAEYSGNDGNISGPWTITNGSSGPMALPVVLTSFVGNYNNENIILTWLTSLEINNHHFEIQKSTDGETFVTIGQLNASTTNSYKFADNEVASLINYYRLLQVDVDGASTYSSIIKVSAGNSSDFVVYPNPTIGNEFGIQFSSGFTGNITIQNSNGTQLYSKTIIDSFLSGQEIPALSAGVYFILVSDGNNLITKKVIVK